MPIAHHRISGLLVLALLGALLWGCDTGPAPTPISGPGVGGTTPPAPPVAAVSNGNQETAVGNWGFSSISLKVYDFLPDPAGGPVLTPTVGTFATALVTILNKGTSTAQLALSDFQLTDSAGHIYTPDPAANAHYSGAKSALARPEATVAPGTTHRIGVVFDVPKGDPGLVLIIMGQARINLGTASP